MPSTRSPNSWTKPPLVISYKSCEWHCSGAVDALRRIAAEGQAAARWRQMGARSEREARGVLMLGRLWQRWGVAACRAQAEHRLRRLWAVGGRREDRRPLQYEDAGEPGRAAREAV
jgi:hypothetical protein